MFNPDNWRHEFTHLQEQSIYLNHAAITPLPKSTIASAKQCFDIRQSYAVDDFEMIDAIIEETRDIVTTFINAPNKRNIAFIPNTSHGLNIVANGIPMGENDEILLHPYEFPTNVYPWMNQTKRKAKLSFLPDNGGRLPLEVIEQRITPKTKVLALSAVQFISGFKADLKAITQLCRNRGIFVVVDGIQAAGCSPIDVQDTGIDALCAGGHKWLMCPQGIGFLYLSDRLLDSIKDHDLGWLSVREPWDFFNYTQDLKTSASRFECGMLNIPGIFGMRSSLALLLQANPIHYFQHIQKLGDIIIQALTELGLKVYSDIQPKYRSGITTFDIPSNLDEHELLNKLAKHKVFVSVRNNKLRFSPHFYNTETEIYQAIDTVTYALKET